MSQNLGASGNFTTVMADDGRLRSQVHRFDVEVLPLPSTFCNPSYVTPWWPGIGNLIYDSTASEILDVDWWEQIEVFSSQSYRFGVTGVTRDVYGTAIASCTVKLFRTSDDLLVDTQTSSATGAFTLRTPYYPDAHYMTAYKSGFPDVHGTSVNTLIGT